MRAVRGANHALNGNPHGRLTVALVAAAIITVLGACSDDENSLDDFPLSREEVDRAIALASPAQRAALEDLEITDAERERAYLEFIDCAREGGVEIYDWRLAPTGGDSFMTRPVGGAMPPDTQPSQPVSQESGDAVRTDGSPLDAVVDACRHQHYTEISLLYEYNHRLTGDDLRQFYADVAACMRARGLDVPEGASADQLSEIDRATESVCEQQVRG